jgi:hypothetical protein
VQKILNYIAEIANTDSAIVANVFWLILFLHIGYVTLRIGRLSAQHEPEIIKIEYLSVLKTMRLNGIAMWFEWAGSVVTRDTVFYWRRFGVGGAGGPMSPTQTGLMVLGASLMVFGTIFMTYVLSHRTLGHGPWVASAVAVITTTFLYLVFFPWAS